MSEEEQILAIAHEVAHMKLRHKSPLLSHLTLKETEKQEEEANDLARKWLSLKKKTES